MPTHGGVRFRILSPLALLRTFTRLSSPVEAGDAVSARRRFVILITLILLCGASGRIIHFAQGRVLYNDELYVAENIRKLSFGELTGKLIHDQRAPLAFLLSVKACWVVMGPNDFSLRFIPLVGGLLGLFAFYPAARVILSRRAALVGLALFAVNDPLIFYSSELKPYAWDALASLLILGMLGPLATRPLTWRYALLAGLFGLGMPFWSFASTIALAGSGVVLALMLAFTGRRRELPRAMVMGGLWVLGIGLVQYIQVRHYPDDTSAWLWVWIADFGPLNFTSARAWVWLESHLATLVSNAVGLKSSSLAVLAAIIGCIALARTRRYQFFLILAPMLTGLVLAYAKFYPFSGRLLLYLYPAMMILIAAAIAQLLEAASPDARRWAIGALAMMLAPMMAMGLKSATDTHERKSIANETYSQAQIKYALRFIHKNWQPGDVIYLHDDSRMWIDHYAEKYGFDASATIKGVSTCLWSTNWDRCGEHLAQTVKGKPRVWVFISQQAGLTINQPLMYRYYLDRLGKRITSYDPGHFESGHAYLYDLSVAPNAGK